MAEMVASAVVGETINRVSTFLIDQRPSERDDMERLEMAHIKMEAVLHISHRWQITDAPMLRWRSRLKRAAQECDDALRHCKQRALEDQDLRRRSFPRRIAHAAKSFISSLNSQQQQASSSVNVRRFERFAEGTGEFLRFLELGGTPRRHYTFFNPLIGDLLSGKTLRYQALQGDRFFYYLGIRPTSFAERGVEAMVGFAFHDFRERAKGLNLRLMLRLSEGSDVFGIIIKCLQSAATPHFKVAAENVRRELMELPTQDFSWVARSPRHEEYWMDVHSTLTQWLRPDPLCCNNEHEEHDLAVTSGSSSSDTNASWSSRSRLACMYPEEVIAVYLQCHISLSGQQESRQTSAAEHRRRRSPNSGSAPLKLAVLCIPHDPPEGIEPAAESYAFEVIDGKEQETVHRNACLQDVDEKLLPKAIDHLCQNSESRMYQMSLRSRHGTAHFCVEKTIALVPSAGPSRTVRYKRAVDKKREENVIQGWVEASRDLLKLWVVRASDKLHGSISSWIVRIPPRYY